MTKKEGVLTAIRHQEPDKVPKGEIAVVNELTKKLLGEKSFMIFSVKELIWSFENIMS